MFDSSWLRHPMFLRSSTKSHIVCTDVITQIKSKKISPVTGLLQKKTRTIQHLRRMSMSGHETVSNQSSHKKRWRLVEYMLFFLLKLCGRRNNSGSVYHADELLETRRKQFALVQKKLLPATKKTCWIHPPCARPQYCWICALHWT